MDNICVSLYHLQVPSIEIAREIFSHSLGLEEQKLKNNNKMVEFKLDKARLCCQVLTEEEQNERNITHSINLYSPLEKIQNAYEYLKDNKNLRIRFSNFGVKKEYTALHIFTSSPISIIYISNLKV